MTVTTSQPILPRILYLGDVPVEESYYGSIQLYRLLQNYPKEKLRILESSRRSSLVELRLPGVSYGTLQMDGHRLYRKWFWTYHRAIRSITAPRRANLILGQLANFAPDAVVTVAHRYPMIVAAEFARHQQLPLHLIVHDDWPRRGSGAEWLELRLDRLFAKIYRQAASRLCVSPYMEQNYLSRYGVTGMVLYPVRARDTVSFDEPPAHVLRGKRCLKVAYGGTISGQGSWHNLRILTECLEQLNGSLLLYSPQTKEEAMQNGVRGDRIEHRGLLKSEKFDQAKWVQQVREEADVLFVPMSFSEEEKANMMLSFSSKLTEYTLTGLPLLIYGPPYCSAVRWAKEYPGVAEIVDRGGHTLLREALQRLAGDGGYRYRLGREALRVGQSLFSWEHGVGILERALSGARMCLETGTPPAPAQTDNKSLSSGSGGTPPGDPPLPGPGRQEGTQVGS